MLLFAQSSIFLLGAYIHFVRHDSQQQLTAAVHTGRFNRVRRITSHAFAVDGLSCRLIQHPPWKTFAVLPALNLRSLEALNPLKAE